jgi:hypothetical protein
MATRRSGNLSGVLKGFSLGLGAMYLFDPRMGRRRRAMLADSVTGMAHDLADGLGEAIRDAGNRLRGLLAETRAMFSEEEISEPQLAERVRAKLGRYTSHPSAVQVSVEADRVTLSGAVLAHEIDDVLRGVAFVRGVGEVVNRLEPHATGEGVPGLQGGAGRTGERSELLQSNWAPATRLAAGVLGGTLLANGLRRPHPLNLLVGSLGFGLLARAASNLETRRLLGLGGGRRGIDWQKTMTIHAPLDHVYRAWSNYQNFPLFMRNVRRCGTSAAAGPPGPWPDRWAPRCASTRS